MSEATLKMLLLGEDRSASRALKGVGNEAQRSSGHLRGFGKVAAGVFTGGLALEGVREFGRFLKESGKAAIEDQASQRRLAVALHNATGATHEQVEATEDWIGKVGVAKGFLENDLRQGLQRLVQATGSVSKAQKEMRVALDASAGSGKSLTAVTTAIAKAQNGNNGALSRLGIKIKDAKGHALTFTQVMRSMAETFHGQATARAQSLQGQMDRLRIIFERTQKEIGYHLLPVVIAVSRYLLTKLIPAVGRGAATLKADLGPAIERVRSALTQVQPVLERVGKFIHDNPETVKVFAYTLGGLAVAIGIVSVATWALNTALDANPIGIVVIAIAALAAGLYYAYTHSTRFREAVNKMGAALKWLGSAVMTVAHFIKDHWQLIGTILLGPVLLVAVQIAKHWNRISSVVRGGISAVIGFVRNHWQAILATVIAGPFGLAVALVAGHWSQITGAVRSGIGRVVSFVKSLPGRITSAIGNLGSLLYTAGTAVIEGLARGIWDATGGRLAGTLHAVTSFIKSHKGPIEEDRRLLTPAGVAIMEGLIHGLLKGEVPLKTVLDRITAHVKATGDRLANLLTSRADFASGFSRLGTSIFGADYSTATGDGARPVSITDFISQATANRNQAGQVKGDVSRLIGLGISGAQLKKLQSEGDVDTIHALAQGTRQQIALLNSLNAQADSDLTSAGVKAWAAIGKNAASLKDAQRDDRAAKRLEALVEKLIHELKPGKGEHVEFVIRGDSLVGIIRKNQQKRKVKTGDQVK